MSLSFITHQSHRIEQVIGNAPVIADNSAILFVGERAEPGISLTGGTFTYNGSPRPASGFAYGAGGTGNVLSPPITFSYVGTGNSNYNPAAQATQPMTVAAVGKLSTTTNIYTTGSPSEYSDTVIFTAWVHRGLFPVAGTVTFKDGANVLAANVPLNSLGLAFFWTSSLAVGNHTVSATFNETATHTTSSDSRTQTVTKASTGTNLTSSVNPSNRNQNVTFTATVTHRGNAVTTGTVTFKEGSTVLAGPIALNGSGRASFSKSNLSQGNHTITAIYNGTANYQTSSDSLSQAVRR